MYRGNVHNLGQYQVVEQPWLIYECAPQYGTYPNVDPATASLFSFTVVGEKGLTKQEWRQSGESLASGTAGIARVPAAVDLGLGHP